MGTPNTDTNANPNQVKKSTGRPGVDFSVNEEGETSQQGVEVNTAGLNEKKEVNLDRNGVNGQQDEEQGFAGTDEDADIDLDRSDESFDQPNAGA